MENKIARFFSKSSQFKNFLLRICIKQDLKCTYRYIQFYRKNPAVPVRERENIHLLFREIY